MSNANNGANPLTARNLQNLVGAAAITASVVLYISNIQATNDQRFIELGSRVETIAVSIDKLAQAIDLKASDRYTRGDHETFIARFCLNFERLNPGILCPEGVEFSVIRGQGRRPNS